MNKMKQNPTALIVLSKCPKNKKTYGIRAENFGRDHWSFTWAFPVKEENAKHEGYDKSSIKGTIVIDNEFPGCPYCGTSNFVVCQCGHINCNYQTSGRFVCAWCGLQGTIGVYTGDKISAGMDA